MKTENIFLLSSFVFFLLRNCYSPENKCKFLKLKMKFVGIFGFVLFICCNPITIGLIPFEEK